MTIRRILVVVLVVFVLSLLLPYATARANNPWFGQGCNTSYTGPGGLRAGGYPPQDLTQDQRQWLFEVFGNNGLASVGYGGQSCPWQQTQPDPPHQAWFGQGCGTSYTGPGGLRAGGYDPTRLSRQQRQWLFEVFGNDGYAPDGYGGNTCPWQQAAPPQAPPATQPPPTQPPAPPSSGGNGNSGGGSSGSCDGALPPRMVVGQKGRVPLSGGTLDYTTMRDKPQGKEVLKVYSGETFAVKDGPVCTKAKQGHLNWWKVLYKGKYGWMPEGYTGGAYWIEPMTEAPKEEWGRITPADDIYLPHPVSCTADSTHAWVQFKIPNALFKYEGMRLESTSKYGKTLAEHSTLLWEDKNTNPRVIRMGLLCRDIWILSPYQAIVLGNEDKWVLIYRVR